MEQWAKLFTRQDMDMNYSFISFDHLIAQHQILCLVHQAVSIHAALFAFQSRSPLRQTLAVLGIKKRSLSNDDRALSFSKLGVVAAGSGLVSNDSIIPKGGRAGRPLSEMLAEKGQDAVRLCARGRSGCRRERDLRRVTGCVRTRGWAVEMGNL